MCFRQRMFRCFEYLELTKTDRLLDCGSGRGFVANIARQISDCSIVALEFERELLPILKAHNPVASVTPVQADLTKIPLADNQFEKAVFTEVIEHIADDVAALREIHRVMAPGGVLALTTPNHRYPFLWDPLNWLLEATGNSPIRKGVLSGIWANHERLYTMEQLRAVVTKAGFVIEQENFLTYYCFPFSHNIVYGLGKELLLAGLLPKKMAIAADRFTYDQNEKSLWNPINLMRELFLAIDGLNDRYPPQRSSVAIAMKLRKPR